MKSREKRQFYNTKTIVRTFVENSVEVKHPKTAKKFVKNKRKIKRFLRSIACIYVKSKQKPNLTEKLKKQSVRKLLESE